MWADRTVGVSTGAGVSAGDMLFGHGFRHISPVPVGAIVWLIHVPCGRVYYIISAVFVDILPKLLYVNV